MKSKILTDSVSVNISGRGKTAQQFAIICLFRGGDPGDDIFGSGNEDGQQQKYQGQGCGRMKAPQNVTGIARESAKEEVEGQAWLSQGQGPDFCPHMGICGRVRFEAQRAAKRPVPRTKP